jgi:two-component system cell cycle sensor histidine kinase/response regulator CckA
MTRIMVVEDEPITAADLEQKLVALGHEVSAWVDTGEEAVALAAEHAPELVLMDIRLRGRMTGIEAAARLRERGDIPVVFLTAFADQETVGEACKTQPYGYLLKPITEGAVAAAVQVALARAAAERSQHAHERWLSAGLSGAGEGLVAVDGRCTIRFVNAQAEALLGGSADVLLGQDAHTIVAFSEGDNGEALHPLDAALRQGRVTHSSARWLLPGAGPTRICVSYSAAPVLGARGETLGAVLVFREERPEPDKHEDDLAGLNALSRQLSHEINNPLTYNLGALQLALRELDQLRVMRVLSEGGPSVSLKAREDQLVRIERLLRSAEEGAERVADVVRELGQFSLDQGDRAPVHPFELAELAVSLSRMASVDPARVSVRLEPAPTVRGSKWQLARVLAYALHEAATKLVGAAQPRVVELETRTRDGWAQLIVRAQRHTHAAAEAGRASPPRDVARFTTVSLALAERVIESHGGQLLVQDLPDVLTITIGLPPLRVTSTQSALVPETRRGSVLVVDDEPMIGRVLEITLQPEHDVKVVQSAEAALAVLENADAFDVILCDMTMPGMSGQEFFEQLTKTRPDLAERVVFMSGGALNERAAAFLKRMSDRCIEKPFRTEKLLPLLSKRMGDRVVPAHTLC